MGMMGPKTRVSMLLAALALVVATPAQAFDAVSHARAARMRRPPLPARAVSLALEDEMGRALETFRLGGETFLVGERGQRYSIRVRNHRAQRVEVVLSVDGRDVVSGRPSDVGRDRGYLVEPFGSVRIEGFRTSLDTVAAFRFSDPSSSFAGRMGDARRVGIIELTAFAERPAAIAMRRAPEAAAPREARGGPRAAPSRMRDRAGNLGTAFGEERSSRVLEVPFVRAAGGPVARLRLRYDDLAGLRARGLGRRAVEPRFAEPPPGWRG
jgi:hypothetical protein